MKQISGEVVSISDAKERPAERVVVDFSPIQDFNGFDRPWAGGKGNNLLQTIGNNPWGDYPSGDGVSWTINSDGSITANGTATDEILIGFTFRVPEGNYYFSGCAVDEVNHTACDVYMWDNDGGVRPKKWDGTTRSDSNYGETLNTEFQSAGISTSYSYSIRITRSQTINNLTFYPMVRRADSVVTGYEPYENKCPILPRTNVSVLANGTNYTSTFSSDAKVSYTSYKNLYDVSAATNNTYFIYNNSGAVTKNENTYVEHINAHSSLKYAISWTGSGYVRVAELGEGDVFIKRTLTTSSPLKLTTDPSTVKMQFATDKTVTNLQVEIGDVPTTYEAYHNLCEIDGAFGGSVDVTEGSLYADQYGVITGYDGQEVGTNWYSDKELYAAGTTPTLGATVVYKINGGTVTDYDSSTVSIPLLNGENVLTSSGDRLTLWYQEKSIEPTPVIKVSYDQRINYLLACMTGDATLADDFSPYSRVEKILYAKLTNDIYTGSAPSRIEKLFMVYCGFANESIIDFNPSSRIEEILFSLINGTSYDQNPLSIAEELLLKLDSI